MSDDDEKRQLRLAVVAGLIGVASIAVQLGLSHPATRMWLSGLVHRVRTWYRADPHEGQVRAFAREVSRWDHEQATGPRGNPAPGGDCGC